MKGGTVRKQKAKRWIYILSGTLVVILSFIFFLAHVFVEPVLRKRLQTLVVDGSDSLYIYQLKDLDINFWGGNVGVYDLQIKVDSTRFYALQKKDRLPSLVMQMNVGEAHLKGIGIFSLLFGKKIIINEIGSNNANVKIYRYLRNTNTVAQETEKLPLWKAIQPRIKGIVVNKIKLDGIKLLYKNEEGSEAKLQFDRCDALVENIRIDSAAMMDTSRMSYVKNLSLRLNDLKFRTADSTYKLKAEWITYNSAQRLLEIDSFKMQPTIKNEVRVDSTQKSWYTVTFDKVSFRGLRLDHYLQRNRAEADSVIFQHPTLSVYQDKLGLRSYNSKIGKYPHQLLLKAGSVIAIQKFIARDLQVLVTEKHATTREVGTIQLTDIDLSVSNIVNDKALIRRNGVASASATGKILGAPIKAAFRFYLDSADGRFDVKGRIGPVTAAQINPVSTRLANIEVPSVQIASVDFTVRGEDYEATADVQMLYDKLSIVFRKRDEATGKNTYRKFLNKILNQYAINPSSTGTRGVQNVRVARLTTQSFFGIIWKSVFEGMQRIMLKSGQIS